jgi:hypothetical protein
MEGNPDGVEITEREIEQFVGRLQEWGKELPETERLLLTLLIERAEGAHPGTFREPEGFGYKPRPPEEFPPTIEEITNDVLKPLIRDRNLFFDPRAWSTWDRSNPPSSTWSRS